MSNQNERGISQSGRAPFIIGVSGYMELVPEECEPIKQRLRQLFNFLIHGPTKDLLDAIVADLVPDATIIKLRKSYRKALGRWPGLGPKTPIVLMCNLAPGADTIAANLVLDEFADSIELRCPLPFPPHIYCGASTFVRTGDDALANLERQKAFLDILARMKLITDDLVEPPTGTSEIPPKLFDALKNIPANKVFDVRLEEDLDKDAKLMEQQWRIDRDKEDDRRYYAAGEYLAVTSHLLVAIWNGSRDSGDVGTAAVAEARFNGPRSGLLPTTSGIPLHNIGPLWHLRANRPSENETTSVSKCALDGGPGGSLPAMRILHPWSIGMKRDCPQAQIVAASQAGNMSLQNDMLALFARTGESLRVFNLKESKFSADGLLEVNELLAGSWTQQPSVSQQLKADYPDQYLKLCRSISTHTRAENLTAYYQTWVKTTLGVLFSLAFVASISLHFFTHWHVGPDDRLNVVQIWTGWIAMALTFLAVCFFAWQRSKKFEAHGHDARAIAEGLRVQVFWNLSGLGKSVAANYMSRHFGELDWIRGVIRGAAMPSIAWRDWFLTLEPKQKLKALRVVESGWVQNQLDYFLKSSHHEHRQLQIWHEFGAVTALAGVMLYSKLLLPASSGGMSRLMEIVIPLGTGTILLVSVVIFAIWRESRDVSLAAARGKNMPLFADLRAAIEEARTEALKAGTKVGRHPLIAFLAWVYGWLRFSGTIALETFNVLVPTSRDSAEKQTGIWRRLEYGFLNFAAHLPLALGIAFIAYGTGQCFPEGPSRIPRRETLCMIAAGSMLLIGALAFAWAEKNLHSELAYQYETMAGLFDVAGRRLSEELSQLEQAIEKDNGAAQIKGVARIQKLIYELGREELDENSEWLLLHRARPLEPVMAA